MNVALVADLHGYLPDIPKADLLIIAGDVCPDNKFTCVDRNACAMHQLGWLNTTFHQWLKDKPSTILIWGNHDFVGELPAGMWPTFQNVCMAHDTTVEFEGLKFYGAPWTFVPGTRWALQRTPQQLFDYWQHVPTNIDVLITHGPPYQFGDGIPRYQHVGDPALQRFAKTVKPRLHVFGHIHEARGVYDWEGRMIRNVAILDACYTPYPYPIPMVNL